MGYIGIDNLYKNQDILMFKKCYALEKIHGSSARIIWKEKKLRFLSGGARYNQFVQIFDQENLAKNFEEKFGAEEIHIYGEAYGGKMQGMSHIYGKELKFIAFEVRIGKAWLSVPQAENVVKTLNLEFVDYTIIPATAEAIEEETLKESVQAVRNGLGHGLTREGVVLRPLIEVRKNNDDRIIAKNKHPDFQERAKQPKIVDVAKMKVLKEAQAIADEWVVPMRLEHVLQEISITIPREDISTNHIPLIIKTMISDVYKEAKGEIKESRAAESAIGKKTAKLFLSFLRNKISDKDQQGD